MAPKLKTQNQEKSKSAMKIRKTKKISSQIGETKSILLKGTRSNGKLTPKDTGTVMDLPIKLRLCKVKLKRIRIAPSPSTQENVDSKVKTINKKILPVKNDPTKLIQVENPNLRGIRKQAQQTTPLNSIALKEKSESKSKVNTSINTVQQQNGSERNKTNNSFAVTKARILRNKKISPQNEGTIKRTPFVLPAPTPESSTSSNASKPTRQRSTSNSEPKKSVKPLGEVQKDKRKNVNKPTTAAIKDVFPTNTPSKSSLQNIAKDRNLIEQILNEDECTAENSIHTETNACKQLDVAGKIQGGVEFPKRRSKTSPKRNITGNFTLIEDILNEEDDGVLLPQPAVPPSTSSNAVEGPKTNIFKNRNVKKSLNKNVTKVKNAAHAVYDFPSLSQMADTSNAEPDDPAADIINKLIAEGKVSVATKRKGTGKPVIKRKRITRKKPLKKTQTQKILKANADENRNFATVNNKSVHAIEVEFADEADDYAQVLNNQSGAFSHLARSVLIHEAKKQDSSAGTLKIQEQRQLLNAARKIISTPIQSGADARSTTINLSPVRMPSLSPRGNQSPWRVNEFQLPTAFNFSCNSSKLPSTSSEHITATPRKKKPKEMPSNTNMQTSEHVIDEQTFVRSPYSYAIPTNILTTAENNSSSSLSSFDKNHSNEENITPTGPTVSNHVFQKPPIPRDGLKKRSPLKPINILQVINLPPWKNVYDSAKTTNDLNSNSKDNSHENTGDSSSRSENSIDGLFGFTELIEDDNNEQNSGGEENSLENAKPKKASKISREASNFKSKLKSLKKWRPIDQELPQSSKNTQLTNLFEGRRRNQRCIKEMLCSTMINLDEPPPPKEIREKVTQDRDENAEEEALFAECRDESSFAGKQPSRTYSRPVRKRKIRHNFIMFPTSDDSSDENENAEENNKESQPKRQRKEVEDRRELKTFINEFNNMCDEVDQYDLVIE